MRLVTVVWMLRGRECSERSDSVTNTAWVPKIALSVLGMGTGGKRRILTLRGVKQDGTLVY